MLGRIFGGLWRLNMCVRPRVEDAVVHVEIYERSAPVLNQKARIFRRFLVDACATFAAVLAGDRNFYMARAKWNLLHWRALPFGARRKIQTRRAQPLEADGSGASRGDVRLLGLLAQDAT